MNPLMLFAKDAFTVFWYQFERSREQMIKN
jgi:hypothetical protein